MVQTPPAAEPHPAAHTAAPAHLVGWEGNSGEKGKTPQFEVRRL